MNDELERLGLKLLETLHLSVPERRAVPSKGVPASVLGDGVGKRLAAAGWFPRAAGADEWWTGARIELRGSELWVHERHESGVTSVGPVVSRRASSMAQALERFVEVSGGSPIDGVLIDWSS